MFWRLRRTAAILGLLPAIAAANTGLIQVTGVRSWSHADSTRVIVETTGPIEFKSDRATNPDRLFFDILHARPWLQRRRLGLYQINDNLVRRVRIAETSPGTTRIVFDLVGAAEFEVSTLDSPDRIVIELRPPFRPTSLRRRILRSLRGCNLCPGTGFRIQWFGSQYGLPTVPRPPRPSRGCFPARGNRRPHWPLWRQKTPRNL